MIWTVNEYAHYSIKDWFVATNTFTGDIDLTGISYYPIDVSGANLAFSSATIKLNNVLMEEYVSLAFTGGSTLRSTRSSGNQHYLMHSALFKNFVGLVQKVVHLEVQLLHLQLVLMYSIYSIVLYLIMLQLT